MPFDALTVIGLVPFVVLVIGLVSGSGRMAPPEGLLLITVAKMGLMSGKADSDCDFGGVCRSSGVPCVGLWSLRSPNLITFDLFSTTTPLSP